MCHGPPLPGNIICFASIKSSAEVALLSYFLAKLELSRKPALLLRLLLDLGFKKLWHFIAAKLSPQARSFYSNYIHNKNFIIPKKYSEILLMAYESNVPCPWSPQAGTRGTLAARSWRYLLLLSRPCQHSMQGSLPSRRDLCCNFCPRETYFQFLRQSNPDVKELKISLHPK
jgi:hypothetical protein